MTNLYRSFIAIDFETTGLDHLEDRIVEVGALKFDAEGGELGAFESLMNPGRPSHPRALAVHGISEAELALAPRPREVFDAFLEFLGEPGESMLIAHNASFDAGFLGAELVRQQRSATELSVFDTLALSRRAFPGFTSYGLDSLSRRLGFDRSGAHRALADCGRVRDLWLAILDRMGPLGPDALVSYSVTQPDVVSLAPDGWDDLVRATREGWKVRIEYAGGSRGTRPREISPRRFIVRGGLTFLVSYCHLDGREKEFRLDRLLRYELIDPSPVR